jgi:predicted nucleic acid-binding protein
MSAREVTENKAILFTSALTNAEIFQGRLTKSQKVKLQALMQRTNVRQVAMDIRIADRASAIREFYNTRGNKIKTPDATHLATAILYRADEMQTMDGLRKDGSIGKILALNGNVAGFALTIVNPYPLIMPPDELVSVKGPLFPKGPVIN